VAYAVTFVAPYGLFGSGRLPLLELNATGMSGTTALGAAVARGVAHNSLGGSFYLFAPPESQGGPVGAAGWRMRSLAYDSGAGEVEAALRDASAGDGPGQIPWPHVKVTLQQEEGGDVSSRTGGLGVVDGNGAGSDAARRAALATGGRTWRLTLPEASGDAALVQVNGAGLSGDGRRAQVVEEHRGRVVEIQRIYTASSGKLNGTFTLDFRGAATPPLAFDASAEDVEAALEALPTVGDVAMRRTSLDEAPPFAAHSEATNPAHRWVAPWIARDAAGHFAWDVTFASHLGAQRLLVACCGSEHAFTGLQTLFSAGSSDARVVVASPLAKTSPQVLVFHIPTPPRADPLKKTTHLVSHFDIGAFDDGKPRTILVQRN
jgi:hypothetical protein